MSSTVVMRTASSASPAPAVPSVPRETKAAKAARVLELLARLKTEYPDAHCELDYRNAFELLAATILSAQCTDVRVNLVTPALFARYSDAHALAAATQVEVEGLIRSTGFFRNKAKSLIGMAQGLVVTFDGDVPRTMAELRPLPGVGRKTANVVLGNAFGLSEGITVDTHVLRLSRLLGLSRATDAVKLEQELIPLIPITDWTLVSHLLIWHGRRVCIANRPRCGTCVLRDLCPGRQDDR